MIFRLEAKACNLHEVVYFARALSQRCDDLGALHEGEKHTGLLEHALKSSSPVFSLRV